MIVNVCACFFGFLFVKLSGSAVVTISTLFILNHCEEKANTKTPQENRGILKDCQCQCVL